MCEFRGGGIVLGERGVTEREFTVDWGEFGEGLERSGANRSVAERIVAQRSVALRSVANRQY